MLKASSWKDRDIRPAVWLTSATYLQAYLTVRIIAIVVPLLRVRRNLAIVLVVLLVLLLMLLLLLMVL